MSSKQDTGHQWSQARLGADSAAAAAKAAAASEFDDLVQLAAMLCATSASGLWLGAADAPVLHAGTVLSTEELTAAHTLFAPALAAAAQTGEAGPLVIDETAEDARFRQQTGGQPTAVRFFAAARLTSPDGVPVGALCVFDDQPRTLNAQQKTALNTLARQVSARLELRLQRRALEQALATAEKGRAALAAVDRQFATFMNSGPFVVFLKDEERRYLSYNQGFANLFGIGLRDWIARRDEDVFPAPLAQAFQEKDIQVRERGSTLTSLERIPDKAGTPRMWRVSRFPCPAEDGTICVGGIALDVTEELAREAELQRSQAELQEANARLRDLAATDPLTTLPNRRMFDERLELEFARARRKAITLAVLMLDVDDFKQRNDTFGHEDGDHVLRIIADLLRATMRATDLAARYGGEEFVVLLPETDEEQAIVMANRIQQNMSAYAWPQQPVQLSIGAAALDVESVSTTPQRLVRFADEALYDAKREGKNCVRGYREHRRLNS